MAFELHYLRDFQRAESLTRVLAEWYRRCLTARTGLESEPTTVTI